MSDSFDAPAGWIVFFLEQPGGGFKGGGLFDQNYV